MHPLAVPKGAFSVAGEAGPLAVLSVPTELNEDCLPEGTRQVSADAEIPDIIVVAEPKAVRLLPGLLPPAAPAILPIVVTSQGGWADDVSRSAHLRINKLCRANLEDAVSLLLPTVARVRALPERLWASRDPREILLARLAVRNNALMPHRDPSRRETIAYADECFLTNIAKLAEELVDLGFLERHFFDAVTICPRCESARVSVRELCGRCHSANLIEEAILHHLRCCEQAPEREFRQGDKLVCPKCRMRLEGFNLDYDRPGNVMFCRECDHVSTDTSVGFVCLDCGTKSSADQMGRRDVWSYMPSSAGIAQISSGQPMPGAYRETILTHLTELAQHYSKSGRPFCVLAARLRRTSAAARDVTMWARTCTFFGMVFRETFIPETAVIEAPPIFMAFLDGDRKSDVERGLPEIQTRLEQHLSAPPDIEVSVFGPPEFFALLGRVKQASL